ncbi:hypothetical protein V8F20_010200 [Naviculisporaceae sp. PSN 640]
MITFSPQCTLPESTPVFVQQPNVRSTMDIIWESLVIIFLSSWSILHLNVPPQFRPLPAPKSTWESIRRSFFVTWFGFKRKCVWMIITILVPELVLGTAVSSFIADRKCTKNFKAFQQQEKSEDEIEWTPTHSRYANMGGFVIKFPSVIAHSLGSERSDGRGESNMARNSNDRVVRWLKQFESNNKRGDIYMGPFDWDTHVYNFSLAEKFIRRHMKNSPNLDVDELGTPGLARLLSGDTWILNGPQLLEARRAGIIERLPNITENEIQDKSKSNGLVSALAILQISWLIVQVITRAAQGRQSSQIEISALAFAACAVFTYSLLFNQPKDVQTPTVVAAARCASKKEFDTIVTAVTGRITALRFSGHDTYAFSPLLVRDDPDEIMWASYIGLAIFGSVHIAAWNMTFPSSTEQIFWRICALYIACAPMMAMLLAAVDTYSSVSDWYERAHGNLVLILIIFFVPARFFLLVESFRSTYYLPPSSYTATWASNIPHIS